MKLRPALSTWQWTFGSLALTLMCVWLSTFPQAQAATLPTGPAHFAATEPASKPAPQNANAAYSLPPEKLAKAIRLSRDYTILQFAQQAWEILFLLLLLGTRVLSRLGNWAETITRRRWLQGLIFLPILLLMMSVSHLPFSMTSHWLAVSYGLSVQHWGSWFLDHGKSLLLTLAVGTFILSILFWLIRRFPQRWWVLFWVGSVPFVVFTSLCHSGID